MCRLLADSCVSLPPPMRRLFWHQLMLASNADGQRDGSGMTDGFGLFKSHYPFLNMGTQWIARMDSRRLWMGHVRAASRHTEISPYAAHPHRFRLANGEYLFAAHNGFITGMPDPEKHEPQVDSYQAFKILAQMITDEITPEIINAWTAQFGVGSEWSFMLRLGEAITIVRGNRPMHFMSLNDGFMFNTSSQVLLHFKDWCLAYWAQEFKVGKIMKIEDFHMTTLRADTESIELHAITAPAKAPDYEGMYFQAALENEELIKQ